MKLDFHRADLGELQLTSFDRIATLWVGEAHDSAFPAASPIDHKTH
jgi:hypothetical protein